MVGGLVEQQHIGIGGQGASQRGTRELTAGEGVQATFEVGLGEAQAARHDGRAIAPQIAAVGLQARLGTGVAVKQGIIAGALAHLLLKLASCCSTASSSTHPDKHIVAQRHPPLARRTLVVQGDAHALGHAQLALVDPLLAGDHAQQGRLAGAVAPGDRESFATLQLEGHAAEQGLAGHVLA